jgi:ketosteroid isomerase-like protein
MSDRDREIIDGLRRTIEAFNRGDFDAAMEMAHPDIEFVPPGGQASLKGAAAMREWMEPEAFAEQSFEPRDFRVKGNKVLISQHTWARGAGSGIEIELDIWTVWTVDDDSLVTRVETFFPNEETEALEAAGLSE